MAEALDFVIQGSGIQQRKVRRLQNKKVLEHEPIPEEKTKK
jgi:hypothetical protein